LFTINVFALPENLKSPEPLLFRFNSPDDVPEITILPDPEFLIFFKSKFRVAVLLISPEP